MQEILDIAFSNEILSPEYFAVLIHMNVLKLDLSTRYQQLVTDEVLLQLQCKVCVLFRNVKVRYIICVYPMLI